MEDDRVAARFIAEYDGAAQPEDALWWSQHPQLPGPSGAVAPRVLLEQLRAGLYRPHPKPGLLAAVRAAEEQLGEEEARVAALLARAQTERAPGGPLPGDSAAAGAQAASVLRVSERGRRLPVMVAAAVAAVLLVGGVLAYLRAVPVVTTEPSAVPSRTVKAQELVASPVRLTAASTASVLMGLEPASRAAEARMVFHAALLGKLPWLVSSANSGTASSVVRGSSVVGLEPAVGSQAWRTITVAVACTGRSYTWTMQGVALPNPSGSSLRSTIATGRGDCSVPTYIRVRLDGVLAPTRLALSTPGTAVVDVTVNDWPRTTA